MTLYIILIVVLIIVIYYCITNKVKIKFKTFFKRGFKVKKGIYGIYAYIGFQGDGKTYSCVEYVMDNYSNIQLFSNVKINNINYIYYNGFKDMLKLRDCIDYAKSRNNNYIIFNGNKIPIDFEKQIVFIYDEIFSELQRGSKLSNDILDFITQMRKRGFILLTTAQIWSDIPITWRRLTRFQIDCKMRNFFGLNLLIKVFHDAEQMKWSNDDQEFIAPIISTTITHTRKFIANSYDTFELIHNKDSNFKSLTSEEHKFSSEVEDSFPTNKGGDRGVLITDNNFWEEKDLITEDWYEEETRTNN